MHLRRSRQVPRRAKRGALRSKVARGCAQTAKRIRRPKVAAEGGLEWCRKAPCAAKRKSCSGCVQSQNARVKNGDASHIPATTCFSGIWRGWGFRVLSCAAKAAFVSRRGEGARMGGGGAPPSVRRLVLRSASREGGSLKPGGGKSSPDRQRRSFVAPGFVVARSAAPSTKNFEEPFSFTSL